MNEQLHTDCSILRNKLPTVLPVSIFSSIPSTKVTEPDLFNQIVQRYNIGTREDRFPSLIFLRLLETLDNTTKLLNINQNVTKKMLNTSIIQYFNFYAANWPAQNVAVHDSFHDSHFVNRFSSGKIVLEEQMNIEASSGDNRKHFVTPRLLRYLQLVNEQSSSNAFESVSLKAQKIMGLLRTLPERAVSQNQIKNNPLILSNNLNEKSDLVSLDVVKAQSAGIQLEKTDDLLKLQHLMTPDISTFDESKPVLAEEKVDESIKAKDIILNPSNHADENKLKTDTMVSPIQKRNRLVYEKYERFNRQTADRYLTPEKKNIATSFLSNTHIAGFGMIDMDAELDEVPTSSNLLSNQSDISLQHVNNTQSLANTPFNFSSGNITRRTSDLVLRKPAVQNSDEETDNSVKSDAITTGITKTDSEKETVAENNTKSLNSVENIADITIIADRVYKLLESKISIEKERRGLR